MRTDPMVGVDDRAEDARRVEARAAVPIDRPVGAHERSGALKESGAAAYTAAGG
jgi:hypothetical protein